MRSPLSKRLHLFLHLQTSKIRDRRSKHYLHLGDILKNSLLKLIGITFGTFFIFSVFSISALADRKARPTEEKVAKGVSSNEAVRAPASLTSVNSEEVVVTRKVSARPQRLRPDSARSGGIAAERIKTGKHIRQTLMSNEKETAL